MKKKYPIYHPTAYATLTCLDFILKPFGWKKAPPLEAPKKLLICQGADLGDVILTTSLLPVLKKAYPSVEIGMAVKETSRVVIEEHPSLSWIHALDSKEIQKVGYDWGITCNFHYPNQAPLLWKAKIPVRIGFESAGFGPLLTHRSPWSAEENRSAAEAYFSLLPLEEKYKTYLAPSLSHTKEKKEDYLVIHMGSSQEKKSWPHWRLLIERLIDEGQELLFTGKGEKEHAEIEKVVQGLPRTKNLCDQLSWKAFVQTVQKARALIGIDTSAGHVAAAVETPAVLIYTSIHPERVWAPRGENMRIVRTHPPCSPCFTGCPSMPCIKNISVDKVYEATADLTRSKL